MLGGGVGATFSELFGTNGAGLLLSMAAVVVAVGVLPGLLLGGLVWGLSVRFARQRLPDALAAVSGEGRTVWRPVGDGTVVRPTRHYEVGSVTVRDGEVVLSRRTVDAAARESFGDDEVWRLRPGEIEGVRADDGGDALVVTTGDGTVRLPATDPDRAVAALRDGGVSAF